MILTPTPLPLIERNPGESNADFRARILRTDVNQFHRLWLLSFLRTLGLTSADLNRRALLAEATRSVYPGSR